MLRILASVLAAAAVMPGAVLKAIAQENVDAFACHYIEAPTAEPFGDEEGRGLSVRDYSCEVTQGPLSGGVFTARAISGDGQIRRQAPPWAAASFASRARWPSFSSPMGKWSM